MPTARQGSIHLFRFAGVDLFLHWSWFLVGIYEIQSRAGRYSSITWNVLEYLALFLIVALHEYGHALACRQVGGRANQIVLWPLGGVAFVNPPPRPGAVLWSIAAGPLVNVALLPVTIGLWWLSRPTAGDEFAENLHHYLTSIAYMNGGLLLFNILPIYPLDGGQILQALLWFLIGRGPSLMTVSILGVLGGIGLGLLLVVLGLLSGDGLGGFLPPALMVAFLVFQSLSGFRRARALLRIESAPRHKHLACPSCGAAPVRGEFWVCAQCKEHFDTFAEAGVCPYCGQEFRETVCLDCYRRHPVLDWFPAVTQ